METDKRKKLTDQDKLDIPVLHKVHGSGIREIARNYGVDKRTIQFIIFPERLEANKARRAERGGWKQYYKKEEHCVSTAKHRAHKKECQNAIPSK